jgi:hypothetical protein
MGGRRHKDALYDDLKRKWEWIAELQAEMRKADRPTILARFPWLDA